MFFFLPSLFGTAAAQRPSNISLCDYYAEELYDASNNDTQFQLVQDIVALAFGGPPNSSSAYSNITGILNPGIFQNQKVNLRPWFNGSITSSNLNNAPAAINWLDGGGLEPLHRYLNGDAHNLNFTISSNQNRLFSHFLVDFSHSFGCSQPPPYSNSLGGIGRLNLAYVHKFMSLTSTDLGYFIDQLSMTTSHFGFSDSDSETLNTNYNHLYNFRCAPPTSNGDPSQGPQLLSLCQDPTCPLAAPSPNCSAYVNLAPTPVASAETAAVSSTTSSTPISTGPTVSSITPTSKVKLSGGAIAGISIGGAAGALLVVGVILFWCRKRQMKAKSAPPQSNSLTAQGLYTVQASVDQKSGQSMLQRQFMMPELDNPTSPPATTKQPMSELDSPTSPPATTKPPMSELDSPTSPPIGPVSDHRKMVEMASS